MHLKCTKLETRSGENFVFIFPGSWSIRITVPTDLSPSSGEQSEFRYPSVTNKRKNEGYYATIGEIWVQLLVTGSDFQGMFCLRILKTYNIDFLHNWGFKDCYVLL